MEAINTALTSTLDYVGTILSSVTSNPILVTLFAGGTILPLAIMVFRKIKNAASSKRG